VIELARSYFEGICEEQGYRKHYDGFATDNIPSTRFDRSYHVEAFAFNGAPQNQYTFVLTAPCTVRLFFKGYRDVDGAIKEATSRAESFIEDALSANRRLGPKIKTVNLNQIVVEPYAGSNDNWVVARIELEVIFIKAIC